MSVVRKLQDFTKEFQIIVKTQDRECRAGLAQRLIREIDDFVENTVMQFNDYMAALRCRNDATRIYVASH